MEQECLKSVSERRQRDVWCTQFNRKTVPHSKSLNTEAQTDRRTYCNSIVRAVHSIAQ